MTDQYPEYPTEHLPIPPPPKDDRRKWLIWVGGGVAAAIVVGLVIGLLTSGGSSTSATGATTTTTSFPSSSAPASSKPKAKGKGGGGLAALVKLRDGQSVVLGTIGSVATGTIQVNQDSGGQVALATSSDTTVRGDGVKAVTDLKQGQRIIAKATDGKANGVLVLAGGYAAGTIASVNGDSATLKQGTGTVTLDISSVSNKPKTGDLVLVRGAKPDGSGPLKVKTLAQVPHTG